jgi:hypothetical protein
VALNKLDREGGFADGIRSDARHDFIQKLVLTYLNGRLA